MTEKDLDHSLQSIVNMMDSISYESLSYKEKLHIAKLIKVDEFKEELAGKIKQHKFNRTERVNQFLEITTESKNTRETYSRQLAHFFSFLDREDIHPLEVRASQANKYIIHLNSEKKKGTTKMAYLRAVSSFYSFLVDLEDIRHNFFRGRNVPWDTEPSDPRVPSAYEIEYIKGAFLAGQEATGTGCVNKRKSARIMPVLIELMEKTGLRVGALHTLKIRLDKSYTGYSKGKKISGFIPGDVYEKIKANKINLAALNTGSIKNAFANKIKELFGDTRFSCHSLRHYFAVTFYNKTKDIVRLARLLHHSSTTITENYLKSLKVYDNKYHNRAE